MTQVAGHVPSYDGTSATSRRIAFEAGQPHRPKYIPTPANRLHHQDRHFQGVRGDRILSIESARTFDLKIGHMLSVGPQQRSCGPLNQHREPVPGGQPARRSDLLQRSRISRDCALSWISCVRDADTYSHAERFLCRPRP